MITQLNKNEYEVATRLMNGGFSSAKNSLEQILQTPIAIQHIENERFPTERLTTEFEAPVHILKTELRGEILGACYLLFTEEEVQKVLSLCPLGDEEAITSGFLKEVDNMVSAAVVAEFANYLGLLMYGDVPELLLQKPDAVHSYLRMEETSYDQVLHYKAIFNGPELAIAPHFVWMFHSHLLDKIKEILNTTIN